MRRFQTRVKRFSAYPPILLTRAGLSLIRLDRGPAPTETTNRTIHQSRLRFEDGKMYLLRVVVAEDEQPPVIISVYRTSKIEKYWSAE
jgi:hypothetical protein